jgi:hypothetical protein
MTKLPIHVFAWIATTLPLLLSSCLAVDFNDTSTIRQGTPGSYVIQLDPILQQERELRRNNGSRNHGNNNNKKKKIDALPHGRNNNNNKADELKEEDWLGYPFARR